MPGRIIAALISLVLLTTNSPAQIFPALNYPQQYFTWPVDAKKGLAANFGELRPNHYHMGLDCRTDQKENRPVLAAADGYIAKVKIEPFGFGRCIYINHPNGLTTVYAHLNNFDPPLEAYITLRQYQLKSWETFLDIPAGLFTVKKGQFIAFSGNTGGSQGPHLHFEIRDTPTDKVLNPLLFGFPLADNIALDILRLAVYDRNTSVFEQSEILPFKKIKGMYTTVPGVLLTTTGNLSFAITAYDRYTGSTNRNGISEAVLFHNESPVCGFRINSISYDETRYLNAHIDYKLRNSGGSYVQHLSRLPGYPPGVYNDFSGDGVIDINDDSVHAIKIVVKDAAGNTSVLQFRVQLAPAAQSNVQLEAPPPLADEFHPGFINVFENSHISFYLPEDALYDAIRFRYNEITPASGFTIFQLHNGNVPVHRIFPVRIKNLQNAYPGKMVMHRYWQDKHEYAKAFPVTMGAETSWYQSSFRAFGYFHLLQDTLPPTIIPLGFRDGINAAKLNRIAFVIRDNTKELENFSASLDGNWIRFSNDKGSTFIYRFDEYCPPGRHELKISVEDCVGNKTERTYHFTR
ncbi:MAG: M23 family metallopeptidase [Ferruginibacter sp.]